jgi:hypothetical protein
MLIFIRHGEKSKKDDINLSSAGYVRRNHLPNFFLNKKLHSFNIPERIIAMKQPHATSSNRPYQTVSMLGYELNTKIENDYTLIEIDPIVKSLLKEEKDTLICWEHVELAKMVQHYIHKKYNKKYNLSWGKNPFSNKDSDDDYTSVWIINKDTLYVYNQFDVIYNDNKECYDIDYSQLQKEPFFSIQLNKTFIGSLIDHFSKWIINK